MDRIDGGDVFDAGGDGAIVDMGRTEQVKPQDA